MVRVTVLLATLGLAINVILWSVPGLVAARGMARVASPDLAPNLAEALRAARAEAGPTPSLKDALIGLLGAEAEALEVAGAAIQNPRSAGSRPPRRPRRQPGDRRSPDLRPSSPGGAGLKRSYTGLQREVFRYGYRAEPSHGSAPDRRRWRRFRPRNTHSLVGRGSVSDANADAVSCRWRRRNTSGGDVDR